MDPVALWRRRGTGWLLAALCALPALAEEPFPHGKLKEDCSLCHASESWRPARIGPGFRHENYSDFPMDGAHASANCRACHASLDFAEAETSCVSCHLDPHVGELGMDCALCHTTSNFLDPLRMRRAHQLTRFPLRAAHAAVDCESCHGGPAQGQLVWVNRDTECVSCHLADYQGTTDPDHQAAKFSTDCSLCHRPTTWEQADAARAHQDTGFPLLGAHAALGCTACHVSGFDAPLDPQCVSCHLDDYQSTTDPDHEALGFSTDCERCHNPTSWTGAVDFPDHDALFPIFSGSHRGRWDSCRDCHVAGYDDFSCIDCHAHSDEAQVTSDHHEVSGFTYESHACLSCHPRGTH